MSGTATLEHLPMTRGYFQLILRCFGDTPERRAAILAGTGVTETLLQSPSTDISLFQQVRQVENLNALMGEGWALRSPDLWKPFSHGALGVASLTAPDIAGMIEALRRFSHVRAPFYAMSVQGDGDWVRMTLGLTVSLDEPQWRPMTEISFIGIRALFAEVLADLDELRFDFACAAPAYADEVTAILGPNVTYDASGHRIRFPAAWLTLRSPFADPALFANAVAELEAAMGRISSPVGLRGRVERLLSLQPSGRLTADETARSMGMSRRTLVRRLAEGGASYRDLLDADLRARAQRMLAGASSHAQIAEALGYADPTSFSRACRRWFGPKRTR